jgi:hypothetical protein
MDELTDEMIMALNAADIGSPMCEQAAAICAEIAEQHCARVHRSTRVAPVLSCDPTEIDAGATYVAPAGGVLGIEMVR